jgi:tetratricopeptide (TPR) repeat protein
MPHGAHDEFGEAYDEVIEALIQCTRTEAAPPTLVPRLLAQSDTLFLRQRGRLYSHMRPVIEWLKSVLTLQTMIPVAVTAGLALALTWPRLWGLEHDVQELRGQLQIAQQHQQEATMRAHHIQEQLIAQVERLAYQSFKLGQYGEATYRYMENSKREPERALDYAIKAATAAWYGCRYEEALKLLESRLGEAGDIVLQHLVLGTIYHSLERLDAAQLHYEQVIAHGPGERLEAAWFNLGVVQAQRYAQTRDEATLQRAIAAVKQSAAAARATSPRQYQARLDQIANALEPLESRPSNACGYGYQVTQDLTALSEVPSFKDWLQAQQRSVKQST